MKDNIRCLDPVMTEKKTMKETKAKREQIIEFIKNQIGVNVDDYRTYFTKQFERKDEIIIEWREMPRKDFRNLELLECCKYSKIRMEKIGVWGIMISLK